MLHEIYHEKLELKKWVCYLTILNLTKILSKWTKSGRYGQVFSYSEIRVRWPLVAVDM